MRRGRACTHACMAERRGWGPGDGRGVWGGARLVHQRGRGQKVRQVAGRQVLRVPGCGGGGCSIVRRGSPPQPAYVFAGRQALGLPAPGGECVCVLGEGVGGFLCRCKGPGQHACMLPAPYSSTLTFSNYVHHARTATLKPTLQGFTHSAGRRARPLPTSHCPLPLYRPDTTNSFFGEFVSPAGGRRKKNRVIHSVPDLGGFGVSFARNSFHPAARNETLFEAASLQAGLQGH